MQPDIRDVIRADPGGWLACPQHGRLPFRPYGEYDVKVLVLQHKILAHEHDESDEREFRKLRKRGCVVTNAGSLLLHP